MGKADISTTLCGVKLTNPTVLASGFLGVTSSLLNRVARSGAGAVTIKSIGPKKRKGHAEPIVVEVEAGLLNAVGLSTQGPEAIDELKSAIKEVECPVIASFYGTTVEEFGEIAARVDEAKPLLMEANISCPNVEDDFGRAFGTSAATAAKVTKIIKDNCSTPVFIKLTPNVPNLIEIAKAVEDAGANGITAINTVGPGMKIDVHSAKPILTNIVGGLSGPAIKTVAVRCVYQISQATNLPVIGTGGVTTGLDAAEMLMAGASAVGVGTATMYNGLESFSKITAELSDFMDERGYEKVKDLVGAAHE